MHLLGYETPLRRLPTERSSAEVTRSTRILLGTLTRTRSLVLWLSDLHWADDVVRQLVNDLLARLGRRPVVVLVTGTAALFEQWAPRPGLFNSLSLGLDGLDAPAMDLLAAEVAGHLDEPTRAALVERAAGNPLFLEEMTRMVSTSGVIDAHALPANVRSVIGARLDVLDERARSVLGDAAVLGLRGTREALRTMSTYTQGDDDIAAAMTALERADLLELTTKQWAFRSNVVRDVVYDRLTKTQRALRHAGVAEWLASHRVGDADTIAMHFRQAAALVDEVGGVDGAGQDLSAKAIEWTLRTLDTEQAGSSLDQVVELQSAALDLAGAVDEPRAELLLRRAVRGIWRLLRRFRRVLPRGNVRRQTRVRRECAREKVGLLGGQAGIVFRWGPDGLWKPFRWRPDGLWKPIRRDGTRREAAHSWRRGGTAVDEGCDRRGEEGEGGRARAGSREVGADPRPRLTTRG